VPPGARDDTGERAEVGARTTVPDTTGTATEAEDVEGPGGRPAGPIRPAAVRPRPAVVGARAELRRQLRTQQRFRLATLVSVVVVILGALPLYLMIQAATRDPVFTSLNDLRLPAWAAASPTDSSFGSRWCIIECRFRERELTSQRPPDETAGVYQNALRTAGWQSWKVEQCPDSPVPGHYSCWRRDEYTLDLWVRDPPCKFDPLRQRPTVGPPASPEAAEAKADDCTGSVVSIKVRNRIDDERGRGPEPEEDASLTGETPDAAFTPDPLTPSPTG
jgi:integrin beta 3